MVVLVVGGPFVYIHFIEGTGAGQALAHHDHRTDDRVGPAPPPPLAGTWKIGTGSTAGYRVKENLFGQSNTAVGRTNGVTGSMTIAGTTVTKASFTVDMTSVTSDRSIRDDQFQGRIMDTADYPTATFALTKPDQPRAGAEGRRDQELLRRPASSRCTARRRR